MSKVSNNFELLKAMDTVVSCMNNDDATVPWLMCGLPDGADDEEVMEIASDDGAMDEVCACFGRVMRMFSKDGWFTNYDAKPPYVAYGVVE